MALPHEVVRAAYDPQTKIYRGLRALGFPRELGGYQGDERTALVADNSGQFTEIGVPAPGDRVQPSAMAELINSLKPEGTRTTPPPDSLGAGRSPWAYMAQLQRQVAQQGEVIDAALVGDRFSTYQGNIGIVFTNQPIDAEGHGQGIAENWIGTHLVDPERDPDGQTTAGLDVLQALEGNRRGVNVDRGAFRVHRRLHGQIAGTGLNRAVIAPEKFTTGGATDKTPWLSPAMKPGITPPHALPHSGAIGLAPQAFVPAVERTHANHGYFLNRAGLPFFQTAGGQLISLGAFFKFNGVVTTAWTATIRFMVKDLAGNVVIARGL